MQADKMWEQRLQEITLRQYELARAEYETRKAVEMAHKQYNLALVFNNPVLVYEPVSWNALKIKIKQSTLNLFQAQEKEERDKLKKLADEEASLAHQLNMFHSELLSEATDVTSVNGPFRMGRDRFKGYTEEMIKTIKEEQLRQAMDKKRREEEGKQFDEAWEKMSRKYAIATLILDKELSDRRK